MSKTPGWQLVKSVSQAIHAAAADGPSAVELLDRRISRRAALKVGGAAVAGLATARNATAQPRPAQSGPVAGIVGAGLAGLHCGHRLAQAGVRVEVYDAARRIGGRVLSDRNTFGPQHCELGGELIDSDHHTMIELARELDIRLLDFNTDLPELHHMVAHLGGQTLSLRELVDEMTPVVQRIDATWTSLDDPAAEITYRTPNGAERLDQMSIADWLDAEKVSGRIRRFLDVAYIAEFGLELGDSSALNLLATLAGSGDRLAEHPDGWSVWGGSDERYHAAEGNDQFVHRLADRVGHPNIHLGRRLVSAHPLSDGRTSLAFSSDGQTVERTFDRVVLAIPFTLLRAVDLSRVQLSPAKRRAIADLGMGRNTKMMCGFSDRVWRTRHGAAGMTLTDLPFQCAWDTSRLQVSDHGIMTQFFGGQSTEIVRNTTVQAQRRDFVNQLEQVYPGVQAVALDTAVRFDWPSYPLVRGSYSAYRTGQWTAMAGAEREAEGTIHFCGEHTSAEFKGFMQGAAESGARAADEVLTALGIPSSKQRNLPARNSGCVR